MISPVPKVKRIGIMIFLRRTEAGFESLHRGKIEVWGMAVPPTADWPTRLSLENRP